MSDDNPPTPPVVAVEGVIVAPSENPTKPTEIEPYKYNDKTVAKLVAAFNNGYNISEACHYASIDRTTYYDWIKAMDGFEALMDQAKELPNRLAKETVMTAIKDGDTNSARWWLDRRDPEFKPKAELDNQVGLKETREKIGEFLDDDDSTDAIGEQPITADAPTPTDEVAITPSDIS